MEKTNDFVITSYQLDNINYLRLHHQPTEEEATIALDYGGNLCSLKLQTPQNELIETIDGYQTVAQLSEHSGYKSAKLLPFPNRIKDGLYHFQGNNYQLPINRPKENHAIHGLFYDQPMRLIGQETSNEQASIILQTNYQANPQGYPFAFIVQLHYILTKHQLQCSTTLINDNNTSAMPLGDGWHPYFCLGQNLSINDCWLQLPPTEQYLLNERNLPTGEIIANQAFQTNPARIDQQHLDNTYRITSSNAIAKTILRHPNSTYQLSVNQQIGDRKYNFLQVYTPAHRQSIAIEPMTCAPNAFNNGIGLIVLEPNETYQASYGVTMEWL